MGEVFRAHDPVLNREVAVKRITAGLDADETVRKRFQREAQSAAHLSHPNIITVYELGFEGEQLFMAMELLDGVDLKHALSSGRKMTLDEKLAVVEQICEGLGLRPLARHRPPRPQARQHPRPPERQGEDHGLRAGPAERVGDDDHRDGHGDAPLHVPGAGARLEGGRPLRRLRAGLPLLRAADRPQAVRRRVDARGAVQDHAGGADARCASWRPASPESLVQVVEKALAKDPAERFRTAGEMLAALRHARRPRRRVAATSGSADLERTVGGSLRPAPLKSAARSGEARSGSRPPRPSRPPADAGS